MTAYRSGIHTVRVSRWVTCPGCGKEQLREASFRSAIATAEAEAWKPQPWCRSCLRASVVGACE